MSKFRSRVVKLASVLSAWTIASSCTVDAERPGVTGIGAEDRSMAPGVAGGGTRGGTQIIY